MKKMFATILLTLMLLCPITGLTEGTRIHSDSEGAISITMPEMAPDFLFWSPQLLAVREYPNGRRIGVFEAGHADGTIWAMVLVLAENDRLYILQVQVVYFLPDPEFSGAVDLMKTEYYEDLGFMKTNIPTNVLTRVEKQTPWETVDAYLGRAGA